MFMYKEMIEQEREKTFYTFEIFKDGANQALSS